MSVPDTRAKEELVQTAIVTGGTSGIGLAIVERLATLGYRIYFCARSADATRDVEERFRKEGVSIEGTSVDVSSSSEVNSWVTSISKQETIINAVINNAGTNGGGELGNISDQDWDRILSTNLNSVFFVTRALSARISFRTSDASSTSLPRPANRGSHMRRHTRHQSTQ